MQSIINVQSETAHELRVHYNKSTKQSTWIFGNEHVLCEDTVLEHLSVSLHTALHLKVNVAVCLDVPLIIECATAELKCFAHITCEAFRAVVHCIGLAIKHGWDTCTAHVECFIDECIKLGYHVLVEIAAACESLKLKLFAGIAKVKLALYWSGAKLHEICESLKSEVDMSWKQFKLACIQAECYIRWACRKAVHKLQHCLDWIKSVFRGLKIYLKAKFHHAKECIMSSIHEACLKVLLPCMSGEIVAKISLCSNTTYDLCIEHMWGASFEIHQSLWNGSKKLTCHNFTENVVRWTKVLSVIKKVKISHRGLDSQAIHEVNIAASSFLQVVASGQCAAKPSAVCFKGADIPSEWFSYVHESSCFQQVEVRRSKMESKHLAFNAQTFTSFSTTLEELKSNEFNTFLHKELTTLTIRVKEETSAFVYQHDANELLMNQRVLALTRKDLTPCAFTTKVEEMHLMVMQLQSIRTLCGFSLTEVNYEFVQKKTKKTVRVTYPLVGDSC